MEFLIEDFEPVLIDYYHKDLHWTHPDIDEICGMADGHYNEGIWNHIPLIRITIENSEFGYMHIVAKSDSFMKLWDEYCDLLGEDNNKCKANEFLRERFDIVYEELPMILEVVLTEDIWSPGGIQFCFSESGKLIGDYFRKGDIKYLSHSPDIGISKDGPNEYSWST